MRFVNQDLASHGVYCANCDALGKEFCNLQNRKACGEGEAGYWAEDTAMSSTYVSQSITPDMEKKWDAGKPMAGLMKRDFPRALLAVAEVATYGVEKYKQPGSWKYVTDALNRYEDALARHDLLMNVEERDSESNLLHAAHRAWNALATLEMILEKMENEDN